MFWILLTYQRVLGESPEVAEAQDLMQRLQAMEVGTRDTPHNRGVMQARCSLLSVAEARVHSAPPFPSVLPAPSHRPALKGCRSL